MKIFIKNKKAFTLVETLVAISIFTMAILGLMSILSKGVTDTSYAKQKMTASYLAQDGIEYVRNLRDTDVLYTETTSKNWTTFINELTAGISYPSPDPIFTRTITWVSVSATEVKIISTVSWNQGSGPHSVVFSESLHNWVE